MSYDPNQPYQPQFAYNPPPGPPQRQPRRQMPLWQPILFGVIILFAGVAIGAAAGGGKTAAAKPGPTVTATATLEDTFTATPVISKVVATHTQVVTRTYTPPQPEQIGEGLYVVPSEIKPGRYHTTGGTDCYWARLSSTDTTDIIDNNNFSGPQTIDIQSGDKAVDFEGDCTWGRTGS